ncbi:MAG TPA: YbhB/YbcL family Raf kinase inhibitor-like protein [Devosiaceae bacterium]|jgi:hypothetical protein
MRNILIGSLLSLALLAGPAFAQTPAPAAAPANQAPPLVMTVPAYPDGGQFPVEFSQAGQGAAPGEGTSPVVNWTNVPEGTKSFVLHLHDLDLARNKTTDDQLHWLVWNIPGTSTGMPEGVKRGSQLPDGSFQISATGPVYRGPGAGANGPFHHYIFELYALDTQLDVKPADDAFATRKDVIAAMQGHVLGKASYISLFKRPN